MAGKVCCLWQDYGCNDAIPYKQRKQHIKDKFFEHAMLRWDFEEKQKEIFNENYNDFKKNITKQLNDLNQLNLKENLQEMSYLSKLIEQQGSEINAMKKNMQNINILKNEIKKLNNKNNELNNNITIIKQENMELNDKVSTLSDELKNLKNNEQKNESKLSKILDEQQKNKKDLSRFSLIASNVSLKSANFSGKDLSGENFSGQKLENANFSQCKLNINYSIL